MQAGEEAHDEEGEGHACGEGGDPLPNAGVAGFVLADGDPVATDDANDDDGDCEDDPLKCGAEQDGQEDAGQHPGAIDGEELLPVFPVDDLEWSHDRPGEEQQGIQDVLQKRIHSDSPWIGMYCKLIGYYMLSFGSCQVQSLQ